jgi:hypothetical protein
VCAPQRKSRVSLIGPDVVVFAKRLNEQVCASARTFESRLEDEDRWVEYVNEMSQVSLRSTCGSWYVDAKVSGRPCVFMPYIGGFPVYVQKCDEVMGTDYDGFVLAGAKDPNAPPEVRLTKRWHVPLDMDMIPPAMLTANQHDQRRVQSRHLRPRRALNRGLR